MNAIIIAITTIIISIIICYTIYKIKESKLSKIFIEKEVNNILDKHNKYEQLRENNDENA